MTATDSTALAPGAQTLFGSLVGGLPQGLGLDWWNLWAQELATRMNASGQLLDPLTGQPTGQPTQQALLNAAQIAAQQAQIKFQEAALSGTINGQPTLDAQRLQQDAQQFASQMGFSQQQLQTQISEFGQQFGLQAAAVTGTYGGQPTLAAQQQQFTQGLQTQQLQLQQQQAAVDQAVARAQQSGTFTDPVTGQNLQTLQAQQQQFTQQLQTLQQQLAQAQFGLQQGELTGTYGGAPTLAATQFQQQLAQQMQQFSGTLGFQYAQLQQQIALAQQQGDLNRANQLQLQAQDLQAQAQRQGLDLQLQYAQLAQQQGQFATEQTGMYNGQQTLAAQQQAFAQGLAQQQFGLQQAGVTGQYQGTPTEATQEFYTGQTGYTPWGAPTLAQQQFQAQQTQQLYERAANPARSFANELARAGGAPTYTGGPAYQGAPADSSLYQVGQSGSGQVTVPAFLNAFKAGTVVPTAGQIQQPNTTASPSQAAVTQQQFQQANHYELGNYTPDQQAILQSYGAAGGVTPDVQNYWLNRLPAGTGA